MGDPSSSSEARTATVRDAYAALNRGDVAGFLKGFDADAVRVESWDLPMGGTCRGLAAIAEHVRAGRGKWAEGTCEPERFVGVGDRVLALARVQVRLRSKTAWREGRTGDVFTFRGGTIVAFREFGEVARALDWMGLAPGRAGRERRGSGGAERND